MRSAGAHTLGPARTAQPRELRLSEDEEGRARDAGRLCGT